MGNEVVLRMGLEPIRKVLETSALAFELTEQPEIAAETYVGSVVIVLMSDSIFMLISISLLR